MEITVSINSIHGMKCIANCVLCSDEEDPDDYPFPLTLRSPKRSAAPQAAISGIPAIPAPANGTAA